MAKAKKPKTAVVKPTDPAAFASAFKLYSPSIEMVKRNIISILLFVIVPSLLVGAGTFMVGLSGDTSDPTAAFRGHYGLLFMLGNILALLLLPAFLLVQLTAARGQTISPDDALIQGFRLLPRVVGLAACLAFIFLVSLLLFIVPIFFTLPRYILAPYYLVSQNLSIKEALQASAADAKLYGSQIWGLIGMHAALLVVVFFPGIGPLISNVGSLLYLGAPAVRYEQLRAARAGKPPLAPIEKSSGK